MKVALWMGQWWEGLVGGMVGGQQWEGMGSFDSCVARVGIVVHGMHWECQVEHWVGFCRSV
jgi:hypothetical protein